MTVAEAMEFSDEHHQLLLSHMHPVFLPWVPG